jgi:hypothetical protein
MRRMCGDYALYRARYMAGLSRAPLGGHALAGLIVL